MATRTETVELAMSIFDSYDADNSGSLDVKEFKKIIKEVWAEVNKYYPVDEKHLNQLVTIYDSNSDNKISRKEFIKAMNDFVEPIYDHPKK